MIRRMFLPIVVLLLAACGSKTPTQPVTNFPAPGGAGVAIGTLVTIAEGPGPETFSPNLVSVTSGQTVGFRNTGTTTHRIVADNGTWDTGELAAGKLSTAIQMTTTSAGAFHCALHTGATGTLTVTGGRGTPH